MDLLLGSMRVESVRKEGERARALIDTRWSLLPLEMSSNADGLRTQNGRKYLEKAKELMERNG